MSWKINDAKIQEGYDKAKLKLMTAVAESVHRRSTNEQLAMLVSKVALMAANYQAILTVLRAKNVVDVNTYISKVSDAMYDQADAIGLSCGFRATDDGKIIELPKI